VGDILVHININIYSIIKLLYSSLLSSLIYLSYKLNMSTVPDQNGLAHVGDHTLDQGITELSLSSKTIHADDFLNKGQDVAPPLHVSTTFRYNRDPDKLRTWNEHTVRQIHCR
jgi:hypothetical protein